MKKISIPLLTACFLAGCAGGTAGVGAADTRSPGSIDREAETSYEREDVGRVREVQRGEIVSLTPVDIDESGVDAGTVLGAVAGGLAGRQVGGGSGRDIMTVVGAAAGGYAGSRLGDGTAQADGVEIGLEMDNGREIAIIQELDEDDEFRVGDRVDVVFSGDKARVEN